MTARQMSLLDVPATRGASGRNDCQTQVDAARAVKVGPGDRAVLMALHRYGELTVDGIADVSGGYGPSLDRRCKALRERGLVRPTGGTALTRRNRRAVLYALTAAGVAYVDEIRSAS